MVAYFTSVSPDCALQAEKIHWQITDVGEWLR